MTGRHTLLALLCTAAVLVQPLAASNANVVLESGVYNNLVLAVKRGTAPPTDAAEFVANVKKFVQEGSEALHFATDGTASFGNVMLVIPRDWDFDTLEGITVQPPVPGVTAETADILLHDQVNTIPDTLQVEQCGVPGRQIRIPTSFLTLSEEEELVYGTKGRILTHEWAHYRWGVHDEHGFTADPVYGAGYGDSDQTPTSCAVNEVKGEWLKDCSGSTACRPNANGCLFCVFANATAADTQASLGYLPALSEGRFCDNSTHNRAGPSPQNRLCGRRSIMELISLHPDADNMVPTDPATIDVTVVHEPMERVVLLVDTPVPGQTDVLDSEDLLDYLQSSLLSYSYVQVAVMAYTADGQGDAQLDITRPFDVINEADYNDLKDALPAAAARANTPKLVDVLAKVVEHLDTLEANAPGTLLVMPVNNPLVEVSLLDQAIGTMLRDRRIKPLLLFPEEAPSLPHVGSFLQWSGSRFLYRNGTEGPINYANMAAKAEVAAFLSDTFQNDHAVVRVDTVTLGSSLSHAHSLYYQQYVVQHRLAVITSSGPITEVGVKYNKYGTLYDCLETDTCTVQGNAILYWLVEKLNTPAPGEEWALEVTNKGQDEADITVTWSEVTKLGKGEELSVQVWSSEGRGPVANIEQNQALSLYVSVMTGDLQVLRDRVKVRGIVEVVYPDGRGRATPVSVTFEDDGVGADLRANDSVFSFRMFPTDGSPILPGTTVTVTELVIEGVGTDTPASLQDSSRKGTRSEAARTDRQLHSSHQSLARGSKRPQSSALFTRDPKQVECCGSFVEDPNTDFNHRIAGFNVLLRNAFEPIQVTRTITYVETTTTSTTTTTTTAPPTTTSTTAAVTTTAEATTVKPTTAEATTSTPITTKPVITTEGTTTTDDAMSILASGTLVLLSTAVVKFFV